MEGDGDLGRTAGMTGSATSGVEIGSFPGGDAMLFPGGDAMSFPGGDDISFSGGEGPCSPAVLSTLICLGGPSPSGQIESSGSHERTDSEEESDVLCWTPEDSSFEVGSRSRGSIEPELGLASVESPTTELSVLSRPSFPLGGGKS